MHTFFINTSHKSLNEYEVLFDIHRENKSFVSIECPMSEWYNETKGYTNCVKQMSDLIDGYAELNNAYNLILYVDLLENEAYSSIKRDAYHDNERAVCCSAMHILFTHIFSESIVSMLENSGRKPQNVLIMFGEEKQFADYDVAVNSPKRQAVMKKLFEFLGLPDEESIEKIAIESLNDKSEDKIEAFKLKLSNACSAELVVGMREHYTADLDLWYDEIINEKNVAKANDSFFERIKSIERVEADRIGVETLSCPYDCFACTVNKSCLAISQLNIAMHLLKCIEEKSIYSDSTADNVKKLIAFHVYTVDEIAPLLKEKEILYAEKAKEIEKLAKSYSELDLAPPLRVFDHKKFGLDEYGDADKELVILDAEQADKDKKEGNESENKIENTETENTDDGENVKVSGNEKTVEVVEKGLKSLLGDEYEPMDYKRDESGRKLLGLNVPPERYIAEAKQVRMHHLDYLKKLQNHIAKALSNYAGKSKANKPALLKVGGLRYAGQGTDGGVLESVENVAQKSYETVLNRYMEFCAGRSVAVTDIEEQCSWFVTRVFQITQSLKKIKTVAVCMLLAIIALYIPFFVIQFEAITENLVTLMVALCSVAIPIALLYVVFAFVARAQKKKYEQEWLKFKSKSDEALATNAEAALKYDQLLSSVIPALRWVYEYKLDVEHCSACCSIADAKVEHHRRKLLNRVIAIKNILSDLEYNEEENGISPRVTNTVISEIDYNLPFCSGKKNCDFYTVANSKFFNVDD